jgi:hypothetical protein
MNRESKLHAALEQLLEMIDTPPARNCSCHISPPCGDCVEYSGLRIAIADAEQALAAKEMPAQAQDPITADQVARAAAAIANARGGRRGMPAFSNPLDILPANLLREVTQDARAALEAARGAP